MCKYIMHNGKLVFARDFLKEINLSAHDLIDSEGNQIHMVSTDQRASHAGVSRWLDDEGLNSCSIGIELLIDGATTYGEFVESIKKTETFTQKHYDVCALFCSIYCKKYGIDPMTQILTHEMVSGDHVRGAGKGKIDPGEGFDYMRLISMVKALMQ